MNIKITMPHQSRLVSPNGGHGSRYAVAAERKRIRQAAHWLAHEAMQAAGLAEFKPTRYRINWYYKGTRPDLDNTLARCKSIIDGACDEFGINDRSLELAGVKPVHAVGAELCGKVAVIFDDGGVSADALLEVKVKSVHELQDCTLAYVFLPPHPITKDCEKLNVDADYLHPAPREGEYRLTVEELVDFALMYVREFNGDPLAVARKWLANRKEEA